MENEYIRNLNGILKQLDACVIENEEDLLHFQYVFMGDEFMDELRYDIRNYHGQQRILCADAFRRYEAAAIDKYLKNKNRLNVV